MFICLNGMVLLVLPTSNQIGLYVAYELKQVCKAQSRE